MALYRDHLMPPKRKGVGKSYLPTPFSSLERQLYLHTGQVDAARDTGEVKAARAAAEPPARRRAGAIALFLFYLDRKVGLQAAAERRHPHLGVDAIRHADVDAAADRREFHVFAARELTDLHFHIAAHGRGVDRAGYFLDAHLATDA